jgi:tRNA dimethylallyltransferase
VTVVAVVGPTATGKSQLSLALAQALGGEVVNADSMQLYQGMDIGTAKLGVAERRGVPHHVLDLWPVTAAASVAEYQSRARAAIDDILARGRLPLLVGGSGLYVRAVLERFEFPGTDSELRAALEAELAESGPAPLYQRLLATAPEAAARILPSNGRRIVRALEVVQLTGSFTAVLPGSVPYYRSVQLGLDLDTALLDERIATRVDRMWEQGLLAEVRALVGQGLREGRTASRALGYQQALDFLDGVGDEAWARAETVRATSRFVRRQRSWFRRDQHVHWLDAADPQLLQRSLALVEAGPGSTSVEAGPTGTRVGGVGPGTGEAGAVGEDGAHALR